MKKRIAGGVAALLVALAVAFPKFADATVHTSGWAGCYKESFKTSGYSYCGDGFQYSSHQIKAQFYMNSGYSEWRYGNAVKPYNKSRVSVSGKHGYLMSGQGMQICLQRPGWGYQCKK